VNVEQAYLFQDVLILPTRLSTKLTFRSHWRTREGGHLVWDAPTLVLLGCRLCSGATSQGMFFGQSVVMFSQILLVVINEGGQYSTVSDSDDAVVEESSDVCEEASDQTDAEEDEAEEAIEELYGPFRNDVM
jgi:hypothetical protein